MGDDRTHIQNLVHRLVEKVVNDGKQEPQPKEKLVPMVTFATRLLSTTVTPEVALDEIHVTELVKKRRMFALCMQLGTKNVMKDGNTQGALKIIDLCRRLTGTHSLQKPWNTLYLLQKISEVPPAGNFVAYDTFIPSGLRNVGDEAISNGTSRAERQTIPYSTNVATQNRTNDTTILYDGNASYPSPAITPINGAQSNKRQIVASSKVVGPPVENTSFEIVEDALVRDVIYAFQGIDGKHIKYDPKMDTYCVDPNVGVSKPTRDLIARLTELGWMYRRVRIYVDENTRISSLGLVHQSLCAALHQELTDYYRLIAVLEAQVNQNALNALAQRGSNTANMGATPSTLTLRRLAIWSQEPLQKLKLMAIIVDGLKGLRGGAILSFVEAYAQHGDPVVRSFIEHFMHLIARPFFTMVKRWVFEGELEDPYNEFFVASDPSVTSEASVWHDKYKLATEMVPSFIPLQLANKILQIGKSINFIHQCCKDTEWVMDTRAIMADDQALKYGSTTHLSALVDETAVRSSRRLVDIMMERFHFWEHCLALKRYMLLGQGDFIQYLLDLMGPELLKPAQQLYRHNLLGTLQTAVRGSNAQYDPDYILNRLDIQLLTPPPGGSGWDIFSLIYHVDTPINTIFGAEAMKTYLNIFQFLWNIKRIEHNLTGTWRRHMTSSHHLKVIPELRFELHKCNIIRNEMIHFILHLQYYIMLEVLEVSWSEFEATVRKAQNLDELVQAHNTYLGHIMNRALLSQHMHQLREILQPLLASIIKFCRLQENVYDAMELEGSFEGPQCSAHCIALETRHAEKRNKEAQEQYERSLQGKWGVTDTEAEQKQKEADSQRRQFSPELRAGMHSLSEEYQNNAWKFRELLSSLKTSPDVNLKFLGFRLDFNEYYATHPTAVGTRAPPITTTTTTTTTATSNVFTPASKR